MGKEPAERVTNILLIMSDDLKASALPAYGNTVCKTPNIDRLAKSGMVFERAYCQGLACSPSRPSMLRSIYPKSKATAPTIGEHLQKHGMHTARVGKIFHMPVPHAQLDGSNGRDVAECWTERYNTKTAETFSPGLYRLLNSDIVTRKIEGRDAKGPNRMWATVETDKEDGSDQADYMVATKAVELLRERKKAGKPFFLGVGFVRPHFPMVQPKKFFNMYPQQKMKIPPLIQGDLDDIPPAGRGSDGKGLNEMEQSRRRMWQAYYGSVTFMDEQLGKVLDELDRLGLAGNTIIVLWGDHGFHLGDLGIWTKHTNYEQANRIPIFMVAPGVTKPRSSTKQLAESVDIFTTIAELAGLPAPSGPQPISGKSLVPVLKDPNHRVRDHAFHCYPRGKAMGRAIRTERYRMVEWKKPGAKPESAEYELYDYQEDPLERKNLADAHPEVLATLKATLSKYPEAVPRATRRTPKKGD